MMKMRDVVKDEHRLNIPYTVYELYYRRVNDKSGKTDGIWYREGGQYDNEETAKAVAELESKRLYMDGCRCEYAVVKIGCLPSKICIYSNGKDSAR